MLSERRGLRPLETLLVVLAGVAVFLFAQGPFWKHSWVIAEVDRSIWWSYAILPLLVLAVLLLTRRLRFEALLFGTVETLAYKFAVTFLIAHAAWALTWQPHERSVLPRAVEHRRASPPPTSIPRGATGELRGVAPPGSLVYVESGLEHFVFAPSDRPLLLEHDGAGISPRISAVQAGQALEVVSRDGRVHTMRATDDRKIRRRNMAVLPRLREGVPFERAFGRLELDCTIHRGMEQPAELIVLGHPFFARTGESGAFGWEGVPAGKLRITAIDPAHRSSSIEVELAPGHVSQISVVPIDAAPR